MVQCYDCGRNVNRSYFCCNRKKLFCTTCCNKICSLCRRTRNQEYSASSSDNDQFQVYVKPIRRNQHQTYAQPIQIRQAEQVKQMFKCYECQIQKRSFQKQDLFLQPKCKKYYCYPCLRKYYDEYYNIIQELQLDESENQVQLNVELKCCEIDKKKILPFLQKYCNNCHQKIKSQTYQKLENQCRICAKCIYPIKKKEETKQKKYVYMSKICRQIDRQIISHIIRQCSKICNECKKEIDGVKIKQGKNIGDGILFCLGCLEMNQRNQQKLKDKNYKEDKNKIIKQRIQEAFKKQENKKKQEQKSKKQCDICNKPIDGVSTKLGKNMEGVLVCSTCLKMAEVQQNIIQQRKQKKQQKKENKVNEKKQPKIQQKNEIEKQKIKEIDKKNAPIKPKVQEIKIIENKIDKKQPIQQKPTIPKKKVQELIQIKKQQKPIAKDIDKKMNKQDNLQKKPKEKQVNAGQNVKKIEKQMIKQNSSNQKQVKVKMSSLHQQFLPVQTIIIDVPLDDLNPQIKCLNCKYVLQQGWYFKIYEKQKGKSKAMRIIESASEQAIYSKSMKLFCKLCYFQLKKKKQ